MLPGAEFNPNDGDGNAPLILYAVTVLYGLLLILTVLITGTVNSFTALFFGLMLIADGLYYWELRGYRILPPLALILITLAGAISEGQDEVLHHAAIYFLHGQIAVLLAYVLLPVHIYIPFILFTSVASSMVAVAYIPAEHSVFGQMAFLIQAMIFTLSGITKFQFDHTESSRYDEEIQLLIQWYWRFNTLTENTQDMVLLLDADYRIAFVNPVWQRIVMPQEPIGKLLHSTAIPAEYAIPLRDSVELAASRRTATSVEIRLESSIDGSKPVLLEGEVFPQIEHDEITGFLIILRDVTLREHSEQLFAQQAQADALKRFMREAAHDLITPLTTMKTNLYLMQHTTEDVKQLRRIELLEDQTDHIERSTQALLKMTRLEGAQFHMEATYLNSFLSNIIAAHRTLALSKEQQIIFEPDTRIAEVKLDVNEFQFVIREMLMNALAHSQEGDTTRVQTEQTDEGVNIRIIDEGDGITPNDLEHVFEPFYRASAREVSKGGIGLGLTLSKWIVDIHHGHITVESQPGAGSSFTIFLPRSQQPERAGSEKKKRSTQPVSKEKNVITQQ